MALRSKNVHGRFDTIPTRHLHQLAMKNGGPVVWGAMVRRAEQIALALETVEARLPKVCHRRSWDAISKDMMAEADRFLAGVEGR